MEASHLSASASRQLVADELVRFREIRLSVGCLALNGKAALLILKNHMAKGTLVTSYAWSC